MRSSPSLSKWKLQSRERMGSLQKLCSLQRKVAEAAEAAEVAKSAKVQRGTREMIREILRTIRWEVFPEVLSLPAAMANHRELLEQATRRSSKVCRHCSKSINWSIGYFDSHHVDRELLDGGQLNCFIQWLVHRLRMDDTHLRPPINVYQLHQISSEYEEGKGIQWGHIVCIRIWEC